MYESLQSWGTGPVVMVLALLSVATLTWLWALPRSLRTRTSRYGLVSFALARTPSRARQICGDWERIGRVGTARRTLGWEYPLIAVYSAALFLAVLLASRLADASELLTPGDAHDVVDVGTCAVLAAAVFDALENAGGLYLLRFKPNPGVTAATWNFAVLKFVLIPGTAFGTLGLALVASFVAVL